MPHAPRDLAISTDIMQTKEDEPGSNEKAMVNQPSLPLASEIWPSHLRPKNTTKTTFAEWRALKGQLLRNVICRMVFRIKLSVILGYS